MRKTNENKWLNWFAGLTAAVTVLLIIAGALVTSTGSGDAVPDWPLSYGTLLPRMVGGVLFEHGHRMIAGATGILILTLAIWLWRKEPRTRVRWVGIAAFVAVVAQALLGGLRVLLISQQSIQQAALGIAGVAHVTPLRITFSVIHAALAQILLCITFGLALVTSSTWSNSLPPISIKESAKKIRTSQLALLATAIVFCQLLLGAVMRHLGAGLVIPDFPLSFGQVVPDFNHLPYDPNASFYLLYEDLKLKVLVHFAHRVGAVLVGLAILSLAWRILRHYRTETLLVKLALVLVGLTAAQIILGAFTIWTAKAIPITVAHVATGALLLATSVLVWLWSFHRESSHALSESALACDKSMSTAEIASNFFELTKPRITMLVLITTLAGFYLASQGAINLALLIHTLIATGLVTSGTNALNMVLERDVDGRMQRTRNRPLPSGRLQPDKALWFGVSISLAGIIYLAARVNTLTSLLSGVALFSYLFLYTPLKRKTPLCTVVGSVSGAIPPVMGWTAVRNEVSSEALILFAILFLWQIPHFFAIAWIYREDYARAGFSMLSVFDPQGKKTSRQITIFTVLLLLVSMLPTLVHLSGPVYFILALALGMAFLSLGISFNFSRSNLFARRFFLASIVYLPALLILMIVDKVKMS